MRWPAGDITAAENMFKDVFYPVIENFAPFANGNWSAGCIKTMLGIGVFTDDRAKFERAADWYENGTDNGAITNYVINATGEVQESGRDQTHTQLGLGFLADASEIAWNQDVDSYGAYDNRVLDGSNTPPAITWGTQCPSLLTSTLPANTSRRLSQA